MTVVKKTKIKKATRGRKPLVRIDGRPAVEVVEHVTEEVTTTSSSNELSDYRQKLIDSLNNQELIKGSLRSSLMIAIKSDDVPAIDLIFKTFGAALEQIKDLQEEKESNNHMTSVLNRIISDKTSEVKDLQSKISLLQGMVEYQKKNTFFGRFNNFVSNIGKPHKL